MKRTRKMYEEVLNELSQHDLYLSTDKIITKPGSWMRRNDPVQFNVGYSEFSQHK